MKSSASSPNMTSTRSKSKSDDEEVNPSEILRLLRKAEKTLHDLQTGQVKMESKLETISSKLQDQEVEIREFKKSMNFLSTELTALTQSQKSLQNEILNQQAASVEQRNRIDTLQKLLDDSQRYSRGYNLRFLGVPEETDPSNEDCIKKIEQLIERQLNLKVDIENAHRSGRSNGGRPRHIIAKFMRRPQRFDVLRQKRAFRAIDVLVFEDLIPSDLASRRNLKGAAQEAIQMGKKVKFVKGDLYIEGRRFIPDNT